MRVAAALPLFAALALAACGSKGSIDAKNESVESVTQKLAASDLRPRPGRWESSVKLVAMDMPGMAPRVREAMGKSMAPAHSVVTCLTPEQASRPQGLFQKGGSGCTYDHFTMAGGQIDAEMSCNRANGQMKMKMQGSYGEDSYLVKTTSQGPMRQGVPMTVTMSITSRRIGECNGTEKR